MTLRIKFENKINELKKTELILLFCIIDAFNNLEMKKYQNEYSNASIQLKYIKGVLIKENINIFKIVRVPMLIDFVNYFISIEKIYNTQSTETKLNLDDYIEQKEDISQEVIITMVFKIKTTLKELNNEKKIILKILKINKIDERVFEIIK
jgi:hypothetical protein